MGILTFVKKLFTPSPETLRLQQQNADEELKGKILLVLEDPYCATYRGGIVPFEVIRHQLRAWPLQQILRLMKDLITAGLVQRIDGGKSEKPATEVQYASSASRRD